MTPPKIQSNPNASISQILIKSVLYFFLGILPLMVVLYENYVWENIIKTNIPQINTINSLEIEFADAHLWLEEYLNGDSNLEVKYAFFRPVEKLEDTVRGIGKNVIGIRNSSKKTELLESLAELKELAYTRIENIETSGAGTVIDTKFDVLYSKIREQLEEIKQKLQTRLEDDSKQQSTKLKIISVLMGLLLIGGLWYYLMNSRKKRELVEVIEQAESKLKLIHELKQQRFAIDEHALVSSTDSGGIIKSANSKFCEVSGYKIEELIGQDHNLISSGYHSMSFWAEMYKTVLQGSPWHGEVKNKKKNGDFYWVDTTIVPSIDTDGIILGFDSIRTEITDRVELMAKEKYISGIVEKSLNEIFIFDASTLLFINVNKGARENLQYDMDELIHMNPSDIIPEITDVEFLKLLEPLKEDFDKIITLTTIHERKDGTTYDVEIHLQHMNGEHNVFMALVLDITDRKKILQERDQSTEQYRLLIENSPYCIHEIGKDGRILSMNRSGLDMMDVEDICEIRGTLYIDSVGEVDRERISNLLEGAKTGIPSEFTFESNSGSQYQSCFVPVLCSAGSIIMGITQDITDRINTERELVQSKKMRSIGQLTGGIAHDFNNVLGSILGFNQLSQMQLDEEVPDKEKLSKYNENITIASNRAKELISHMMSYSRVSTDDKTEYTVFVLSDLVKEIMEILYSALPSSLVITTNINTDVKIETNSIKLHQLLMNLCINAKDAMDGVGEVEIGIRRLDKKTACSSCHERIDGSWIELYVKDAGTGIPRNKLDNIFEPFYTTKEVGKGTGMGLSIVHGIVHDHGGHIQVATSSEGTTFSLLFREQEKENTVQPKSEDEYFPLYGNSKKILVVDDEEMIGTFTKELLETQGYVVEFINDPELALEYYSNNFASIDLVVTDQTMPRLTGSELTKKLKGINKDIKVIISSGNISAIDQELLTGDCIALSKPMSSAAFFQAIDHFIN